MILLCLHLFLTRLGGASYRCSPTLDDASFDKLMDVLHWRMPYDLRAFHCDHPEEVTQNPIFRSFQELAISLGQLLTVSPPGYAFERQVAARNLVRTL